MCHLPHIATSTRKVKMRRAVLHAMQYCLLLSSVFMIHESLRLVTKAKSPVVVVISESMKPAFSRGDILFVWNRVDNIEVGDIAVCWFDGRDLPMVHRVIKRIIITSDR